MIQTSVLNSGFVVACLILGTATLCHGASGVDEKESLLAALRDLRAGTFHQQSSGHARIQYDRWQKSSGREEVIPNVAVDVVFRDADARAVELFPAESGSAGDPRVVVRVVLSRNGKVAQYATGKGPIKGPAGVVIHKLSHRNDEHPQTWSFRELAEIPTPIAQSEGEFFEMIGKARGVSVERTNTLVSVTLTEQPPAKSGILKAENHWEFDMAMRGMLTAFRSTYNSLEMSRESGKQELNEVSVSRKIDWRVEQNDSVTPVKRHSETSYRVAGQVRREQKEDIVFAECVFADVKPDEFSLDRMGIPEGVPVQDQTLHRQWRYVAGVDLDWLSPATSQPGGR